MRGQADRDGAVLFDLSQTWRAQFLEKGWLA
jgi:hypothetical protein